MYMHLYVEMGELEVYVSFECTARLHFRAPQRPVEHRCRLTLGGSRQHHQTPGPGGSSTCVLTVEGEACQRRTFRVRSRESLSARSAYVPYVVNEPSMHTIS